MAYVHVLSANDPPTVLLVSSRWQYRLKTADQLLPPASVVDFLEAAKLPNTVQVQKVRQLFPPTRAEDHDDRTPAPEDALISWAEGEDRPKLHGLVPPTLYDWVGIFVQTPTLISEDYLGITEIGQRLAAPTMTMYGWAKRPDFPAPKTLPGRDRKWKWGDVENWAMKNRPTIGEHGRVLGLRGLLTWATTQGLGPS